MRKGGRSAFSLVEVVVSMVAIGLVITPLAALFVGVVEARGRMADALASRAWRELPAQLLAADLEPELLAQVDVLPALASTSREMPEIRRRNLPATEWSPEVRITIAGFAGGRAFAGIAFGPALATARRRAPHPPLSPVLMPDPELHPAPGSRFDLLALRSTVDGAVLEVEARPGAGAPSGAEAELRHAAGSARGTPARREFPVAGLLSGGAGAAWTEWNAASAGAIAVRLADGRTRWFVPEGSRFRRHEPSGIVTWHYGFRAPPPQLALGGALHPHGAVLLLDFAAVRRVLADGDDRWVHDARVVAALGAEGGGILGLARHTASFRGETETADRGAVARMILRSGFSGWADAETLKAGTSSGLELLEFAEGRWVLERRRTRLGAPWLASPPYFSASIGPTHARSVTVVAPDAAEGVPARLEIDGAPRAEPAAEVRVP